MKREFVIFLIKKLAKVLFTVWVVTTLIFFLIRLMPSNPIQQYVQNLVVQYGMTYEEASARASSLFSIDLDANVFSQYIRYLQQAARLDFGTSFLSPGVQVSEIIAARLPWTLFTVGSGLLLSFIVGTVLGAIAAYRRESWYEPIISGVSSFLSAIPDFLIAIFLILFFGVFTWGGRGSIIPIFQLRGNFSPGATIGWNWEFIGSVLDHAMVPILTYFFSQIGIWVLLMKGSTAGCLNADYATIARARGDTGVLHRKERHAPDRDRIRHASRLHHRRVADHRTTVRLPRHRTRTVESHKQPRLSAHARNIPHHDRSYRIVQSPR